jgi:hypothetical protein
MSKTFIGKPCAKCGGTERYIVHHNCLKCARERFHQWAKEHPQRKKDNECKWRLENPEAILLIAARHRAKQEGLPFTITEADIIIPERCPVLGIKLERGAGAGLCSG